MSSQRVQALRRTLHLSIDPSPYASPDRASLSSSGSLSPSSSARASIGTSLATHESTTTAGEFKIFSVLCLYDFHSDDPDHLPFRKSEILDVVKTEESGWWAAMRPAHTQVGWVPSAFVRPLTDEMAERLRGLREELRIYDYEAERLYNAAPTSNFAQLYPPDADSQSDEWVPVAETQKEPAIEILSPTELIGSRSHTFSPQSPLRAPPATTTDAAYFTDADLHPSPADAPALRLRPPPSPVTPMPQPPAVPPKTAPAPTSKRKARCPQHQKRYNSLPEPPGEGGRLLPDDRSSLSRLSVLVERSNVAEPDDLSAGEAEELLGGARPHKGRPDKVKQLTGDEDAQRYHNAKVAALRMPWYLKPDYKEEDVKLNADGSVLAGTLEALVECLTIEPISKNQDMLYQNTFLMTFRTFASADRVFDLLVDRYQMDRSFGLTDAQFAEWKEKKLRPTQKRVLVVLGRWLEEHRMPADDAHVVPRLQEFLSLIVEPPALATTAKLMIASLERLSSPIASTPSSSTSNPTLPRYKKRPGRSSHRTELLKMDPTEVAQQLCVLEYNLYSKIRPQECLDWTKTQMGRTVENLHAFCATYDKLAAWVKTSILDTDVLGKRADTVEFWIRVAEKSRTFNNLSSFSALVAALSSAAISRLHLTMAHVSRSSHLDALAKVIEPTGNFAAYRAVLQTVDGPCVPWVGMYLSDLVHIGDQHPDTLKGPALDRPLINFYKRQKWADTVSAMLRFQGRPYPFAPDAANLGFIETNLQKAAGKDHSTFWLKSQEVQQSELAHADIRKGLEAAGF